MKITCSKQSLTNGIGIVSRAVPVNTTMPILKYILINAAGGEIRLTANDTDLGIETVIEGVIETSGIAAIEASVLSEAVRKMPDGDIHIDINEKDYTVHLTCDTEKIDFQITGTSGDDFTYLPEIEKKEPVEISMLAFKDMVRQTAFSLNANNENNRTTTGFDMIIYGDYMRLTTLDGHRVSIRNVDFGKEYEKQEVIIPGKTLKEISAIIPSDAEKFVSIYITDNHISFEFDNTVVVSRLIDGEYINVDKMITSEYKTKVVIDKKRLANSIDRSLFFSKEGNKKPIVVDIKEGVLNIQIKSSTGGLNEDIEIEKEGNDLTIGFNPKFVLDALKAIDDDEVTLYFINSISPVYIKDEKETCIYMILPINLS